MSKSARSISLQFWLPVVLISIGIVVWAIMTWQEYIILRSTLIKSSEQYIQHNMTLLQRELQIELRKGNYDEAEQAVTTRGVDSHYRMLAIVDDQTRISYCTKLALKGRMAADVLPSFNIQQFKLAVSRRHANVKLVDNEYRFISYFPLILERRPDELRSQQIGVIFLDYDFNNDMRAIWNQLLKNSLLIAFALLITLGLLFGVLKVFITRPINMLVESTKKIASGDYTKIENIKGSGEISQLAEALNDMSRQLKERAQLLERSIMKLQEKERWQHQLLNTLPHGIQENDVNGLITFSNAAHHRMLDVKDQKLVGCHVWDFQPGDEKKQELVEYLKYLVEEQPKPTPYITTNLTADGRELSLEIIWDYQRNEAGEVTGFISVISDITERKQTEEALRRSQKMDAVGQLTGGIAHDFNNILGIIIGNLTLLEMEFELDSKAQQRIDIIKHSSQRAVDLVRQLLRFSSHQAISTEVVDINKLIARTTKLITQSLTPQIETEYHCEESVWLTEINAGDFEDVLLNLALNARDAMSGRGKLTIETHKSILDEDYCSINPGVVPGDYVQLTVSDTGEGISSEQQALIFEPFYTTKEQGKGTGLGLAMVFGFVRRSGGHIKVYSEPGIGTTFRIYLPKAVNFQQQSERQPKQEEEVFPKGKETILVVDDEQDLLNLTKETLQLHGYKVVTASNATEAMEKLKQNPDIDLLFSDVVMPGGLNGYELAEQAVKQCSMLKIVLTSGYTETAIAKNGQARFNANLLSKPYTREALLKRIHEVILGDNRNFQ